MLAAKKCRAADSASGRLRAGLAIAAASGYPGGMQRPSPSPGYPTRRTILAGLGGLALPASASGQGAAAPRLLVAAAGEQSLRPAPATKTALWLIDGATPGPVLRARPGETLRIALENRTPKPLAFHAHGVRGLAGTDGIDGFGGAALAPGARREIALALPDPGSFLYRPLVPGAASELGGRGLGGMIVVEEPSPPDVDHDLPVLIADWLLDEANALRAFIPDAPEAAAAGRLGSWITANGAAPPLRIAARPGSRIRLRLANGCNARIMRLRFDGARATVIAVDGQPTDGFEPVRSQLPFAPGSRYDVILDLPGEAGAAASVTALVGPGVPLVRLVAEGEPRRGREDPPSLAPNPALPAAVRLQNAARPQILIEGGARPAGDGRLDFAGLAPARPWRLNGGTGDPGKPLFSVKRGTPVVIGIENRTHFIQPLHVHGHAFRLLHPLDDGWEPYFLDTVQIPDGRKLHIAFIADNPGRWPITSTVLERFDLGLWTWFEVV